MIFIISVLLVRASNKHYIITFQRVDSNSSSLNYRWLNEHCFLKLHLTSCVLWSDAPDMSILLQALYHNPPWVLRAYTRIWMDVIQPCDCSYKRSYVETSIVLEVCWHVHNQSHPNSPVSTLYLHSVYTLVSYNDINCWTVAPLDPAVVTPDRCTPCNMSHVMCQESQAQLSCCRIRNAVQTPAPKRKWNSIFLSEFSPPCLVSRDTCCARSYVCAQLVLC